MFGIRELKDLIRVTETKVECPIRGCVEEVLMQRKSFKRLNEFKCKTHNIYISTSTFEYENKLKNILWKDETDRKLLNRIRRVKRESRIARDNSEDAVTWNIFRFLEKNQLLGGFLEYLIKKPIENPEVIYWSYSQLQKDTWPSLKAAREEFETLPKKGSEPDIIIKSNSHIFFVEAKLTATNNTLPRSRKPEVRKKYEMGGNQWYQNLVLSDFVTIAVTDRKYELLRFWLLGSWIAHQLDLDYCLINLVLSEREKTIEEDFRKHIRVDSRNSFLRTTWEEIYHFVSENASESPEKSKMTEYFRNKTLGYKNRRLQKAFLT